MCFPIQGSFPPERSRLRRRWFVQLLQEASRLRCVSSRGLARARMAKPRRRTYAAYKRDHRGTTQTDATPTMLAPLAMSAHSLRKGYI